MDKVGGVPDAAFSYAEPYPEAARISGHLSFDPDLLDVRLDDHRLLATSGQEVVPHGPDRDLTPDEPVGRDRAADAADAAAEHLQLLGGQ